MFSSLPRRAQPIVHELWRDFPCGSPVAAQPGYGQTQITAHGAIALPNPKLIFEGKQSQVIFLMQAVLFVTHIESERIYKHFLRIKAESCSLLDSFLCVHASANSQRAFDCPADFRLSAVDEAKYLPARYAEKISQGGTIVPKFSDLAYMPALLSPRLSNYSYIWIIEYDVDFAGRWDQFFSPLLDSHADLIGTTLLPKNRSMDWMWWASFHAPPTVSDAHHTRSFIPVARFSRRMISQYHQVARGGEWQGHSEALFPTVAAHYGLTMLDFGGNGPFTPRSLAGKNYLNTPSSPLLRPGTFTTPPADHASYFHETPEMFAERGFLYHPVKAKPS
jgi:hypothetical protein